MKETVEGFTLICLRKLSKSEGKTLLENAKQRLRLQQEARTIARIEQLEIEACEKLGRPLQAVHLEHSGELECPDTATVGTVCTT